MQAWGTGDGTGREGGRLMRQGENGQTWNDAAAAEETVAVSPAVLVLVGISVLFLLAGIVAACLVRH